MDKALELIKGCVRPIITLIGFLSLVTLVLKLGFQFGDRDIALLVIGEFLGVIVTITAFWFKERSK